MSRIIELIKTILKNDRPFRLFVSLAIRRVPFDIGKLLKIKIQVQDYFIYFHSHSSLAMAFWCNPNDRSGDYEFIINYLLPDDTYVDIGANIGTTLIPAAKRIETGHAIGFEPHPTIFSYLKENITLNKLNDTVKVYNCAVGSEKGELSFSNLRNDDQNRIVQKGNGMKVAVCCMDDIIPSELNIHLLKVDVEGYEKFVFEGASKTLKKTACIFFEVCEEFFQTFGYSLVEILTLLEDAGFQIFLKRFDKTIQKIDCNYQLTTHHTNLLAIKDIDDFIKRTGWKLEGSEPPSAS